MPEISEPFEFTEDGQVLTPCPSCGHIEVRTPYDIGDGPELSCSRCEWCWGVHGQPLSRVPPVARPFLEAQFPGALKALDEADG